MFDTDNSKRDRRMREVMSAEKFKNVTFKSSGLKQACTPGVVMRDKLCSDILVGDLTILAKTKKVEIPVFIKYVDKNTFSVEGELHLRWAEYGIEDPSIFIARLNPVVTVFFKVQLNK